MTAEVKISELPEAIVPLTGTELLPVVQSNITRKVAASALIPAVDAGTTTTGLPGTNAAVVNSGVGLSVVLDFTIPRGDTGATGNTGAAATIAAGTTTTGAAGTLATVVNSGSSSAAVFNFTIPQGVQGIQGIQGNTGDAATVAAGTTTTGAAGSSAIVVNSGSSSAAVFDFTIPQGTQGIQGIQGNTGNQGIPGINWLGTWGSATAYAIRDAVTYNGTSYYAIASNTNQPPPNVTYWNILAQKGTDGSGAGTVTSVGLSAPALFTVSGSPVTSIGSLGLSYSGTALPTANGGTGTTLDRPSIRPSLLLDFANTRSLDPRITFTRASTGTFYDPTSSAIAEQNLLLQSQTFGTTWITANGTLTTGILDPSSGTTATTLTATSANATVYETVTLLALPYTISFYVQRVTGTGTVNLTLDGTNFTAITVTGSWVRYSATVTPTAGSKTVGIQLVTSGDAVNIWGAQLEQRSTVSSYTLTTTATITNYIPVLQTAASGVARFNCNPTTRESLGLLIEESRTNLFTYSDDFSDAVWNKGTNSITSNTIVSPDGTLDGDKFVEDTTTGPHSISIAISVTTGTVYTLSVYAKKAERTQCAFVFSAVGFGTTTSDFFDLSNGTVLASQSGAASITAVGNDWYRIITTRTATATASSTFQIRTAASGSSSTVGNGYNGLYIWGAQLEAGAFPTSYIPTAASQVTRASDNASMTGTNFSSWYNVGQGSFYSEFIPYVTSSSSLRSIVFVDAAIPLYIVQNTTTLRTYDGTTVVVTANSITGGVAQKGAVGYGQSSVSLTLNAGTVATGSFDGQYGTTAAYFGSSNSASQLLNGTIKRFAYYPTRLSNTELQGLTS